MSASIFLSKISHKRKSSKSDSFFFKKYTLTPVAVYYEFKPVNLIHELSFFNLLNTYCKEFSADKQQFIFFVNLIGSLYRILHQSWWLPCKNLYISMSVVHSSKQTNKHMKKNPLLSFTEFIHDHVWKYRRIRTNLRTIWGWNCRKIKNSSASAESNSSLSLLLKLK